MSERVYLSAGQIIRQRRGATILGPGVWTDAAGGLHFSVPDILQHFGWPDTPENREIVTEQAQELLAELCPDAEVVVQDEESGR